MISEHIFFTFLAIIGISILLFMACTLSEDERKNRIGKYGGQIAAIASMTLLLVTGFSLMLG
ncbi:MAG: hypothetical protein IJT54_08840 [Candidatus Methanomethylophilaceae archaeon]|nr:hypothetical protein [Candidatus Methanomethylophilaceae archaeon]